MSKGIGKLQINEARLAQDLDNSWELLALTPSNYIGNAIAQARAIE